MIAVCNNYRGTPQLTALHAAPINNCRGTYNIMLGLIAACPCCNASYFPGASPTLCPTPTAFAKGMGLSANMADSTPPQPMPLDTSLSA